MDNYTPKIHSNGEYVEMLIKSEKCKICERTMIKKLKEYGDIKLFPSFCAIDQKAQARNAGLVFVSKTRVDGYYICDKCEEGGKADFLCALCNERKTTDKIQESFGYITEYLCSDCYSTVPAKIWDDKFNELEQEHRYDDY